MRRLTARIAFISSTVVLLLSTSASSAFAGQGYGAGAVAGESTGGGSGILPFTGADLVLFALVGFAVLASGLFLRGYTAHRAD